MNIESAILKGLTCDFNSNRYLEPHVTEGVKALRPNSQVELKRTNNEEEGESGRRGTIL